MVNNSSTTTKTFTHTLTFTWGPTLVCVGPTNKCVCVNACGYRIFLWLKHYNLQVYYMLV